MTLIDIELADKPLDINTFNYLSDEDYPYCMLGFQLKNLYDQQRLIIKPEYMSADVVHFIPGETIMPKFFRGIKINFKKEYNYLLAKLEALNTRTFKTEDYKEILREHKLSCNNCFAYLQKGVYPIDSEHVEYITDLKLTQEQLYTQVLDVTHVSEFQALSYFVIYVLSNKNKQQITTKNFLKTAVKNYLD